MRCPFCSGYASPEGQTGVWKFYRCVGPCGATFKIHLLTGERSQ